MVYFSFLWEYFPDESSLGGPHLDCICFQLEVEQRNEGVLGDAGGVGTETEEAGHLHPLLQPQQTTPVLRDQLRLKVLMVLVGKVVAGNPVGPSVAPAPQDEFDVATPVLSLILFNSDNSSCVSEYEIG